MKIISTMHGWQTFDDSERYPFGPIFQSITNAKNWQKKRVPIIEGMARAFFACAWADACEEAEADEMLSGQDIMSVMPSTIDPAAVRAAWTLSVDLERKNERKNVVDLFTMLQGLPRDGADRELTPELFGHYLAMQSMGTGVGLESFGHAARDAINVPYCEFGSHSLERDYF